MKILITGSGGMLGRDLVAALQNRHELIPLTRVNADITDEAEIRSAIVQTRPDVVIHAAAMTAVDDCELKPELAFEVNSEGTRHVAEACAEAGAAILYVSTDYVFDGEKHGAYLETDPVHPVSVYGASKLEGEKHVAALVPKHWIVRTSWVFGANDRNFVEAILGAARKNSELRVVSDQRGCPTYTRDLAAKTGGIIERGAPGIYHVSNQGACSRFEFAQEILRQAGFDPAMVAAILTTDSGRRARRPKNSELANTRLISAQLGLLPDWKDALGQYFQERR